MKEIWKDIKGYEGYYKVSNLGRVCSTDRHVNCRDNNIRLIKGKILKGLPDKRGGYLCVMLCKGCKKKCCKIHRLVAIHFCDGYNKSLVINHKDGNRTNNTYTNLEFCTQKENVRHAANVLHKTWGGPIGSEHPKSKRIAQYTLDGNFVTAYGCIREMARETGFDSSGVCKALKGKSKQAYNYLWKYL